MVRLPGIGEVKTPYVIGGVIVTGGIVGLAYYRRKQNIASAVPADQSSSSAADPGIDPSTGLPYSQENLGYSDTGGSYYGSGNITGYDQYGNPVYSTGITGSNQYTTNSGWATQAENDLQALGVDYTTGATAISRVLAGLSVTTDQQNLFMEAVGLDGQPPQGYPVPVKVVNSPAQANTARVPDVTGQPAGEAHNVIVAAGLVPSDPHAAVKGEPSKKVKSQSPSAGTMVKPSSKVTIYT